jgi:hypothetical protein
VAALRRPTGRAGKPILGNERKQKGECRILFYFVQPHLPYPLELINGKGLIVTLEIIVEQT